MDSSSSAMVPLASKKKMRIDRKYRLFDFQVMDMELEKIDPFLREDNEIPVFASTGLGGHDDDFGNGHVPMKPKKQAKRNQFVVQMFGINETGETACIFVTDVQPFFYVEIPSSFDARFADRFRTYLATRVEGKYPWYSGSFYDAEIVSVTLVERHDLYGFQGGKKSKFLECVFRSEKAFKHARSLWYLSQPDGYTKYEPLKWETRRFRLFESNIPPLLRMFHINGWSPSGWVRVLMDPTKGTKVVPRAKQYTTCANEYICCRAAVIPLPTMEALVPFKMCSFDLEASSSHGDFPLPVKTYKRLARNIIDALAGQRTSSWRREDVDRFVETCVYGAFGFKTGGVGLVDLVYVKQNPSYWTKENVGKAVASLLQHVLGDTSKVEDSLVHVRSAIDWYEKIRETTIPAVDTTSVRSIGQCHETDEAKKVDTTPVRSMAECRKTRKVTDWIEKTNGIGGEEDMDPGADSDGEDGGDAYSRDASSCQKRKAKKSSKTLVVQEETTTITTCADLLLSSIARDDKIRQLDDLLMAHLPPLKGDEVTFLGSSFMRYGETEPYRRHCLVVGKCASMDSSSSTSSSCPLEIQECKSEAELLKEWAKLIQREDPDLLLGYNIFGFDYEFLFRRSIETGCMPEFVSLSRDAKKPYYQGGAFHKRSRKRPSPVSKDEAIEGPSNEGPSNEGQGPAEEEAYDIEHSKVVLASGEYDLKYVHTPGRLQIDLYTYFRRDYQLASYKLDDVASQFLSDDIVRSFLAVNDDDLLDETHWYTRNLLGLHVGDYVHVELTSFTTEYYDKGRKFLVKDLLYDQVLDDGQRYHVIVVDGHWTIDERTATGKKKGLRWGMAKNDLPPQEIFRLAKGSLDDKLVVAKYCVQDCDLVHHLLRKLDVLTGFFEMASICSVPVSFLVFRGQGIKLTSYVAKKCREKATLMPDLDRSGGNEGYEGAIVLPPKCGMYMDNPVACVDFASLYPSSMISNNLSHDSLVYAKTYTNDGKLVSSQGAMHATTKAFVFDNLPGYEYVDITYDNYEYVMNKKVKVGYTHCRWAQFPGDKKAIMPSILVELLKARADTRARIKGETDPFMRNVLDKRQLAYKVTANSLYGQCGAKTSTFYHKMVAACTTAFGRQCILYVRKVIEDRALYALPGALSSPGLTTEATYVYGDTDSVFFSFGFRDAATQEEVRGERALIATIELAQEIARLCSLFLNPPMDLAYEKTLMPFLLLSKKRYVGMLYETNPTKGKLKYMGLALKRRDSCDYLKDVYGGVLDILMTRQDVAEAATYLQEALMQLLGGGVPTEKLLITKALRSDYKNPQQIAHHVLAERIGRRDPGNKPKSGERLAFLHIFTHGESALQGDKIETPEYVAQHGLPIDYGFYITNQLLKPLQQLFGLALEPILVHFNQRELLRQFKREMAALERQCEEDMKPFREHDFVGRMTCLETLVKKKEKWCAAKVKLLLFEDVLQKLALQRCGQRDIASFFMPKAMSPSLASSNASTPMSTSSFGSKATNQRKTVYGSLM